MPMIENEKDARRLARAIASDLAVYNDEKIVRGIEEDNLFTVLEEEIAEGRAHYRDRVAPPLLARNFFDRALVDVLVRSKADVDSKMW